MAMMEMIEFTIQISSILMDVPNENYAMTLTLISIACLNLFLASIMLSNMLISQTKRSAWACALTDSIIDTTYLSTHLFIRGEVYAMSPSTNVIVYLSMLQPCLFLIIRLRSMYLFEKPGEKRQRQKINGWAICCLVVISLIGASLLVSTYIRTYSQITRCNSDAGGE